MSGNYLHADMRLGSGDVVEVNLSGNAANVMLMDSANFANYRARRQYSYHGGHFTRSPVHVKAPRTGQWILVIDLGGAPGRVTATYRVLPT